MIIDGSEQGSMAWYACRAGCITASNFHLVRADARLKTGKNKGQYNDKAARLAFKLGVERISHLPLEVDEGFEVWQAKRGHGLEPYAKLAHERKADILVETAGFIRTDDGLFGASADGFAWLQVTGDLSTRIGCEYKCYLDPTKLSNILLQGDTSDVIDQCNGGMWITGLDLWHFGLYAPALSSIGLDFTLIPIERDDDEIERLEADLWTFNNAVEEVRVRLIQRAGLHEDPHVSNDLAEAVTVNAELSRIAAELPANIFD